MIWYVLITECMWYGNRNKSLTEGISEDIKSGSIAYNLNKPYSYLIFIITKHFGEITLKFIFYFIISILLGFIYVGPLNNFSFNALPLIIISIGNWDIISS